MTTPTAPSLLNPDWPQILEHYSEPIIDGILNIAAAAAILLIGLWLSGFAAKSVKRVAQRHPRIDNTLASFFSSVVRYALLAFVLLAVLRRFGVETTSIVAVMGAAALAIGLALQGTLSNLAAGVMLVLFRPYRVGDFVEVADRTGTVNEITLFTTELTTLENLKLVVPNGLCWGAPMVNYTSNPTRRTDVEFGVAYDTDINHATRVIEEQLAADPRVLKSPPALVRVNSLGDFSINLLARYWTATDNFLPVRFDLRKNVKEAFDRERIVIPFPTATNYEYKMGED